MGRTPKCDVCGDAEAGVTPKTGVMRKHTVGIDRTCRGSGKPPENQPGKGSRDDVAQLADSAAGLVDSAAGLVDAVTSLH